MSEFDRYTTQLQQAIQELNPSQDVSEGTVNYDYIIRPNAAMAEILGEDILTTLNNMSIKQVLESDDPDEELVENLLSNLRVTRTDPEIVTGFLAIYFTKDTNISIPSSTVFTCAGTRLAPLGTYVGTKDASQYQDTEETRYAQMVGYNDTENVILIAVRTLDPLTGSLSPGQDCTYLQIDPRIQRVKVASAIVGRAEETTQELLGKAVAGVSATVLTGKDNIRNFLLNNELYPVRHAEVFGMGDSVMLRDKSEGSSVSSGGSVDAYVRTDDTPSVVAVNLTATRDGDTWTVSIPEDIFPGAYMVTELKYQDNILTEYQHVVDYAESEEYPRVLNALHSRYSTYQRLSITYEYPQADPDWTEMLVTVSVMYMGGLDLLQPLVEDPDVRSSAFDIVIKGAIPLVVSGSVTARYPSGVSVPDVTTLQRAIADAINSKNIGRTALHTSDIVVAVKEAFPECTVQMPIHMTGVVPMPDGRIAYTSTTDNLAAPSDDGIDYRNVMFTCYPGDFQITLVEE